MEKDATKLPSRANRSLVFPSAKAACEKKGVISLDIGKRVAGWKRIFETEDNAILKALSSLAWDVGAYSCVVEMVRQAPAIEGEKQLNGMVMDLLATGFWTGTMQGVRRLVEKMPIQGPKGVCSLGGLIDDVRACREQLTREVFVSGIAGLEYNYHRTLVAKEAFCNEQIRQGNLSFWVPRQYDFDLSVKRHAEFDWLSGVTPGTSRPDDLIRDEVFDMLVARLERLSDILEHVNVEIAHAATSASRAGRVLESWGLQDAKQALREITEVAQVVGNWFCYSGAGMVLPVPQFDQFAHLEKALYHGDRARLQAVWDEFEKETRNWHRVEPAGWMGNS